MEQLAYSLHGTITLLTNFLSCIPFKYNAKSS